MKRLSSIASALTAVGLALPASIGARESACRGPTCGMEVLLVGTQGSGPGQGIEAVTLDPRTGALTLVGLAAQSERPTWLVKDPQRPFVYAVSETGNDGSVPGGVSSFGLDRGIGMLRRLSHVESGGSGATYLDYDPRAKAIVVANYADGRVAALPVAGDGRLGDATSVQRNVGSGPNVKRQRSAHAHAAVFAPGDRFVVSPDLGADKVFVYRWDAKARALSPAPVPFTPFPAGSGPRHVVFTRDGRFAFVDTELTGEVHVLRWNGRAGTLDPVGKVALDAPDYAAPRSASELALSPDGRFLYVANRGADALHVFAVDRGSGSLSPVQRIDCGGRVPWSFAIDPTGEWLLVANQGSNSLSLFARDPSSGKLTATSGTVAVEKPVAITFVSSSGRSPPR